VTPNGGETWPESGLQRIEWHASDADGDQLYYQVQYSIDAGETWSSISIEMTENFMEIDAGLLGGSDQVMVRVIASDGFNTVRDDSDAVFSVPAKAPQLTLVEPVEGQTYFNSAGVILKAFALDYEDGEVAESAFVWSSDIDGDLGTGSSIWGLPLKAGEHKITVAVTDQDGNEISQSVNITILEDLPETLSQDALGDVQNNSQRLIGIVLVILGGLLAFFGYRYISARQNLQEK
jgi:hypothetical protein